MQRSIDRRLQFASQSQTGRLSSESRDHLNRPLEPFWLGLRWLTAGRLVAEAVSECQVERKREKRAVAG